MAGVLADKIYKGNANSSKAGFELLTDFVTAFGEHVEKTASSMLLQRYETQPVDKAPPPPVDCDHCNFGEVALNEEPCLSCPANPNPPLKDCLKCNDATCDNDKEPCKSCPSNHWDRKPGVRNG